MKILYLLKREPDKTLIEILESHKRSHEVSVIDMREDRDYVKIIEQIAMSDKVISW
ncbi:MAG: hypothetical protein V3V59_00305 [Thermodesulfovibrionales bacterium]